ncbi:MAG: chorismate-binding protein [Rhodospirillales bacterium]|nr:chorismate-binding protein [Rhodospirillales bacterium]MDP6805147.1 chorismate-binding protein [Rhodospirillales bacterium]
MRIREGAHRRRRCRSGGGIVADSDPADEYAESMDKAGALLQSLDPGFEGF